MYADTSRDGLLQVADVSPQSDGGVRVTVVEMIGERGYIERRREAVRRLARRVTHMSGPTRLGEARFDCGHGLMTVTVWPAPDEAGRVNR